MMMGRPPNALWKCLGYPSNPFWWANWAFITPALLTVSSPTPIIAID